MIRRSTGRSRSSAGLARRPRRTAPPRRSRPPENSLDGAGHPHLAPAGWALGKPVGEFLTGGPLPPAEGVAVILAVLSALAALHRDGRVHGGVGEASVGVAADGWVRLAAEAGRGTGRGRAGDLRDCGALLCRLLGVPAEADPSLPTPAAERTSPALVAVARSLAGGAALWSAEEAWTAVKDAAGHSGSEPQLVEALADLADRVGGATPVERAVTRIVVGPPLRAEPLPPVRQRHSLVLPEIDLGRLFQSRPALPSLPARSSLPSLPALASLPSLPEVAAPKLRAPRLPKPRLGRRLAILAGAALLLGVLVGGAAGAHLAWPHPKAAAAATPPKTRRPAANAPAQPAGLFAQTPAAAVSMFFQLVRDQKLDQAALLWKPKMASSVDLKSRFSGITSLDLRRDDTVAEDDSLGIATVEVDWVETHADGSVHEYVGEIFTDTGPELWRWDSWNVHEVTADTAGGGGGDGGDGG